MKRLLKSSLFFFFSFFVGRAGRRALARWVFHAEIDPSASIGVCFIDTEELRMGPRSQLGHLTIMRNLEKVVLEDDGILGTFNWVFGARGTTHFRKERERSSSLLIRCGASVTSRHILDCTDTIEIGRFATVAGFRSQILTHAIDVRRNRQSCAPVTIGAYSFIGTGTILLKGAKFPKASILSAGSVYSERDQPDFTLYSGVPAGPVRDLPKTSEYMNREKPDVE